MEQILNDTQHLLSQVQLITEQYEKIAELNAGNFNVFQVLGLSTNEVRTHSAFIAELLDPKGSHSQKDMYLKLFVDQLGIKDFDTESAIVIKEKFIGFINNEYTEGGYIDIVVTDKNNHAIMIENKINAEDQYKQLQRYHYHGKKNYTDPLLLYLSPDRIDASEDSKGNLSENDYIAITYKNEIINWLDKCKSASIDLPILRETISQYIQLIKILTNQTTDKAMKEEIIKQITSSTENLRTFLNLYKNDIITGIFEELIEKFKIQMTELAKEKDMELVWYNKFGKEENGFRFVYSNDKGIKYYLSFIFSNGLNNLIYGIENYISEEWINNPDKFEGNYNNWNHFSNAWIDITDNSVKKIFSEKINLLKYRINSNLK